MNFESISFCDVNITLKQELTFYKLTNIQAIQTNAQLLVISKIKVIMLIPHFRKNSIKPKQPLKKAT